MFLLMFLVYGQHQKHQFKIKRAISFLYALYDDFDNNLTILSILIKFDDAIADEDTNYLFIRIFVDSLKVKKKHKSCEECRIPCKNLLWLPI